jgi:hypothetical protein
VPFIADLKPSGKYVMEDLQNIGGTPAILKYLLKQGLLDGSCMVRSHGCPCFGTAIYIPDKPYSPGPAPAVHHGALSTHGACVLTDTQQCFTSV